MGEGRARLMGPCPDIKPRRQPPPAAVVVVPRPAAPPAVAVPPVPAAAAVPPPPVVAPPVPAVAPPMEQPPGALESLTLEELRALLAEEAPKNPPATRTWALWDGAKTCAPYLARAAFTIGIPLVARRLGPGATAAPPLAGAAGPPMEPMEAYRSGPFLRI